MILLRPRYTERFQFIVCKHKTLKLSNKYDITEKRILINRAI